MQKKQQHKQITINIKTIQNTVIASCIPSLYGLLVGITQLDVIIGATVDSIVVVIQPLEPLIPDPDMILLPDGKYIFYFN